MVASLLMIACEKEGITPAVDVSRELKVAESHLTKSQPILQFAQLEINHQTNQLNGFIIDKQGDLYKVFGMKNHSIDLTSDHISDNTMREILAYGNKDASADLSKIELVENAKMAAALSKTSEMSENTAAQSTQIQLAFRRDLSHNASGDCSTPYDHGPLHHQIVITALGKYNFTNSEQLSPVLSTYLNQVGGITTLTGAN